MRTQNIMRFAALAIAAAAIGALLVPAPAVAAGGWAALENPNLRASDSYWTAERMKGARPLPLPKISADAVGANDLAADAAVEANGVPTGADGAPPKVKIRPEMAEKLFDVDPEELAAARAALDEYDANSADVEGDNVGTSGGHFSSSRVFPDAAVSTYPYLAVGKLFFTIPGQGNFICSGSVIRRRVILTAGHCVHSGNGQQSGFYTNFRFVPAYRNGTAPVGSWNWAYVIVTSTWFSGGASFPNAADYAMIEPVDLNGQVIGNRTGFLGYQTLKLNPNHAHLIGYPANLDSGERMHQVTAQAKKNASPNAVEYGSDMRGGSSGGPWIQNFGVVSSGQTGGSNSGSNRVIGITSYGYVSTTPLAQGSSIPDSRFTSILNTICAHRSGNC